MLSKVTLLNLKCLIVCLGQEQETKVTKTDFTIKMKTFTI